MKWNLNKFGIVVDKTYCITQYDNKMMDDLKLTVPIFIPPDTSFPLSFSTPTNLIFKSRFWT